METLIIVLAIIFAVVMLFMLPKYAKFIHQQPHLHMEKMKRAQENDKNPMGKTQDSSGQNEK